MSELREGQTVTVSYAGTVEALSCANSWVKVRDRSGEAHYHKRNSAEITPVKPASWPPRIGDMWRAGSRLYAVSAHSGYYREDYPVIRPVDQRDNHRVYYGSPEYGDRATLEDFANLDPELVFRPEEER